MREEISLTSINERTQIYFKFGMAYTAAGWPLSFPESPHEGKHERNREHHIRTVQTAMYTLVVQPRFCVWRSQPLCCMLWSQ